MQELEPLRDGLNGIQVAILVGIATSGPFLGVYALHTSTFLRSVGERAMAVGMLICLFALPVAAVGVLVTAPGRTIVPHAVEASYGLLGGLVVSLWIGVTLVIERSRLAKTASRGVTPG